MPCTARKMPTMTTPMFRTSTVCRVPDGARVMIAIALSFHDLGGDLLEQRMDSTRKAQELARQGERSRFGLRRVEVPEHGELGIVDPGAIAEGSPQMARLAHRDDRVFAVVEQDDEGSVDVPDVRRRRHRGELLLQGERQMPHSVLRL